MSYRPFVFAVALILVVAGRSSAAGIPGPYISYEHIPASEVTNPVGEADKGATVTLNTFKASFGYPMIYNDEKTILIHGISYSRINLQWDGWDFSLEPGEVTSLHALEYEFFLKQKLTDETTLITLTQYGIYSDFEDISYADTRLQGGFLFDRQVGEDNLIGLGVMYSADFGQLMPLPLFHLHWHFGDRFRADLWLPLTAELWYDLGDHSEIGLRGVTEGNVYRGGEVKHKGGSIQYSRIKTGAAYRRRFGRMALTVEGGTTLWRDAEYYDRYNGMDRDIDLANAFYGSITFGYVLPRWDNRNHTGWTGRGE